MGVLFVAFAASMAAATFIENDYGASTAYNYVYDTRWFELILLLLSINLIGQILAFKLYKRTKLTIMIFHCAFVVMIAGAAITRYTGWEGTIHIREGEEQSACYSSDKFIGFTLKDKEGKIMNQASEEYYLSDRSAGNYKKKLAIGDRNYNLVLTKILPNAAEVISDSPGGKPMISILIAGPQRETVSLISGDSKVTAGLSFGLNSGEETDVIITSDSSSFSLKSKFPFQQMSMMTQETVTFEPGQSIELNPMQIITVNGVRLVPQEMSASGELKAVSVDRSVRETGRNALILDLLSGNETAATFYLWDDQSENVATSSSPVNDNILEVFYGPRKTLLPFSLKLNDFSLERYPGSNSPSGYKSDVVLLDKAENVEKPFTVFMNNILKYKGYRFYQSSYDPDEMGTILSVNHDFAGMFVTYSGYLLLFLFIMLSLLNKKSTFNSVKPGLWNSALRKALPVFLIVLLLSGLGNASGQKLIADRESSAEFGKVLVQDQKGRTKPLFTLSNDILRKLARENKFEGMTSMQVFLGLYFDFDNWKECSVDKSLKQGSAADHRHKRKPCFIW